LTDVEVTITFSRPITIDELKEYKEKYGLLIKQVNARLVTDKNERYTISSLTSLGLDETDNIVQNQASSIQDGIFKGYTDLYAIIDYDKISNIIKNKRTYLVDSSGVSVFNEDNSVKKSLKNYPHALTWDLENLELTN
jgi:hypothetical protein